MYLHQQQYYYGKIIIMKTTNLSPREIVSELDRHIIGQDEAKKSVAIALRNRWRRQQVEESLKEEIIPKIIGDKKIIARITNNKYLKNFKLFFFFI